MIDTIVGRVSIRHAERDVTITDGPLVRLVTSDGFAGSTRRAYEAFLGAGVTDGMDVQIRASRSICGETHLAILADIVGVV